eukprot:SAG22_NODE_1170_length_5261_cov_96.345796_2_plen_129_part_00
MLGVGAVAILFLLDVDNAVFSYCLPESVRANAEATGRAIIRPKEKRTLAFTKQIHTTAVAVAIPLSAFIASFPQEVHYISADGASSAPSFIAFFICGILEARAEGDARWRSFVPKVLLCMLVMSGVVT